MPKAIPGRLSSIVAVIVAVAAIGMWAILTPRENGNSNRSASQKTGDLSTNQFVGSHACAECHATISESYSASGMGRSLRKIELAEQFDDKIPVTFSPDGHHHYSIERTTEGIFHHERLTDRDGQTLYDQAVKIDYAMGSGNQGRSYLIDRGGLLFMSPIGWYSRARKWDLSPGYKLPSHQRFERLVTEGCLECHTGQMDAIADQQNRFRQPPFHEESIGCERCHGPGGDHVRFHRSDSVAAGNDPIVNPKHLDPAPREDVCNQCHLQGEGRYLRDGSHFGDFRPGQRLEDVYVILVKGTRATTDGKTQAVSQVEQMRSSLCFQKSDGRFGCVSCHDPHSQPARASLDSFYRDKCRNCHTDRGCSLPEPERLNRQPNDSCIACHMPHLNAIDVPHTSQTDHRILRVPGTIAEAGESADESPELFDGAEQRLPPSVVDRARGIWLAEQAETKSSPQLAAKAIRILLLVSRQFPKDAEVLNALGMASAIEGQAEDALTYWKQALAVEPNRELTLRAVAIQLQKLGRHAASRPFFEKYLHVQPWNALMWSRYSHLLGQLGETDRAIETAKKAIELDPSHARTYEWLAEIYDRLGDEKQRRQYHDLFQRLRDVKSR